MEKPKCKLCGERHWGACPGIIVKALAVAVSTEAIERQMRKEGMTADSLSPAKQTKRKAKPRNPVVPGEPSHLPSHQGAPDAPSQAEQKTDEKAHLPSGARKRPAHITAEQRRDNRPRDVAAKYAPLGDCPYCDRQRALNAKAVSLHRAKRKPVSLPT